MLFSDADSDNPNRSLDESLAMVANLIYLARHTQPGSAGQFFCLDQAGDIINEEREKDRARRRT